MNAGPVVEETADQRRIQVAKSSWQGRFPAVAEAKVSSGRRVSRWAAMLCGWRGAAGPAGR